MDVERGKGDMTSDTASLNEGDMTPEVAVGITISGREGRDEFFTTCPYCKKSITTEITTTRNAAAETALKRRFLCLTIFFGLSGIGVIGMAIKILVDTESPTADHFNLLFKFVLFLAAFPLCTVILSYLCYKDCYQDVEHYCSNCKEPIGISNGWEAWKAPHRRDGTGRDAVITYAVTPR